MYSFIVLGIIPGTNLQITFIGWLITAEVLALTILIHKLSTRHFFLHARVILNLYAMSLRPLQARWIQHTAATLR